jgi:hypothetical protein
VTIQAATVGRWKLDDYPVGTVLKVGDTFHDSVGGRDAVLCAVDPAQADTQYLPVVTNGFPAELAWEPKLWTTNSALLEMCDKAIWFKGGGLKGYYLKIADDDGALKTSNMTFELFGRSVNKKFSDTVMSMPAAQDGSWGTTNSFRYASALATWPHTGALRTKADSPTGYTDTSFGWNATAKGDYYTDAWFHLAVRVSNGTLSFKRDHQDMWSSCAWTHPDNTAPFIVGGAQSLDALSGCVTQIRISDTALSLSEMMFATPNGAVHGTVLYHASFDEDAKCHGTVLDNYVNCNKDHVVAGTFLPTNAVQARYVHPGKEMPEGALVKNFGAAAENGENLFYTYFGTQHDNILRDLNDFTLECFVKIDEVFGTLAATNRLPLVGLGHYSDADYTFRWGFKIAEDGRPIAVVTAPNYWEDSYWGAMSILDGQWHHLAMTVSENPDDGKVTVNFYVDHVLAASKTATKWYSKGLTTAQRFHVCRRNDFSGAIDEVRVTKGILDPQTEMLWQRNHGGTLLSVQ